MKKARRTRKLLIAFAMGYLVLWTITALVGLPHVDHAFDRELATGSVGFGDADNRETPVQRIDFFDLADPGSLSSHIRETPWRCRSKGVAVAPFVIVDEAAWQDHLLSGFGGRRLVFWVFGYVRWIPLRRYWVS